MCQITRKLGGRGYPQFSCEADRTPGPCIVLRYKRAMGFNSNVVPAQDYAALGDFRYRIRQFLHFSEETARAGGLEAQQHQMLLAIRVLGQSQPPTVGMVAERLLIRHHSAVGLLDRLQERGWVERTRGSEDRRQVRVQLTPEGERKLDEISLLHLEELRRTGPALVAALRSLLVELACEAPPSAKEGDVSQAQECRR